MVDRLEDAQKIADEAISLFKNRDFKLVKWSANKGAKVVLSSLENDSLAASICDFDLQADDTSLPSAKTLGCVWNTEQDKLLTNCSLKPVNKYTRRTMLSQLGQNFDPLGFGALFFLKARLIL